VTHEFLRVLSFKLVIFPISTLLVATVAIRSVLAEIRARGTPIHALASMMRLDEFRD
jgi:2-methylisocitrate lyase-like PEP mutase family enzyme